MARAIDRMKRSGWRGPRQSSNAAGEQQQQQQQTRGHHDNFVELAAAPAHSRAEERSPPRGPLPSHNRSTSTRWHRRQSNAASHQNAVGGNVVVDRYLSHHAEVPMPATVAAPPTYAHGSDECSGALDYMRTTALVPMQIAMAAVTAPSPASRIQPEWEWACSFARMEKCSLVDGVVSAPPDFGVVVGVVVKNAEVLRMLEASEREACDTELNIRASLAQPYQE